MIWILLIIGVVIFLILKYKNAEDAETRKVNQAGGMKAKYSVLINCFLAGDPLMKISQVGGKSVLLTIPGINIQIIQGFQSNVIVRVKMYSTGEIQATKNKEWSFNENKDQTEMYNKIMSDLEREINVGSSIF